MQLVIVGAGADVGKHAELLARMKMKSDVMIVPLEDLTEEDQNKLNSKENLPVQEVIPYKARPIDLKPMEHPTILHDDIHKEPFSGFKRKKFKPSQGRRK